jgi:hypothetical protein
MFVAVSMMTTFLPRPVLTKIRRPSGEATAPIGRTSSPVSLIVCSTVCVCASMTLIEPPFSSVT